MREMSSKVYGMGLYRHFKETICRPLQQLLRSSSAVAVLFLLLLCAGAFVALRLLDQSILFSLPGKSPQKATLLDAIGFGNYTSYRTVDVYQQKPQTTKAIPLNCSFGNLTRTCPARSNSSSEFYPPSDREEATIPPPETCPDYFRWLYNDLWAWRKTGISKETVMSAKGIANFRLVIVNGTAYVETYRKAFQTRDTFTQWGILQLIRRYPGKIPDLDLMFDCEDLPAIEARDYYFQGDGSNSTVTAPPPLFKYCANNSSLDIPFPDWSFWGWPEVNIKPWEGLSMDLKQANENINWTDREPYAYWKGNPSMSATRMDMLTCNPSEKQDWGARLYSQDWFQEQRDGFKESNLANQCTHRYKIYIEGRAWSVSEKYILACDSPTLLVKPRYHDFFSRSLVPLKHYWPIKDDNICRSIKHAVDWGNNHHQQAHELGKAGTKFTEEELKMDYVYDYMLHLFTQYAKLLTYMPSVPPDAVELCSELFVCDSSGLEKQFLMESMQKTPSQRPPCSMPPPFDPATIHSFLVTKQSSIHQVEYWENQFWNRTNK